MDCSYSEPCAFYAVIDLSASGCVNGNRNDFAVLGDIVRNHDQCICVFPDHHPSIRRGIEVSFIAVSDDILDYRHIEFPEPCPVSQVIRPTDLRHDYSTLLVSFLDSMALNRRRRYQGDSTPHSGHFAQMNG